MNRKGYIFSFLALVIAVVLISALAFQDAEQDPRQTGLHDHIISANHFLLQLEEDLPRVLFITGYRGLLGLEEHVSSTGTYIQDLPSAFAEVITNGTVNGTSYGVMQDTTLYLFERRMQQIAFAQGMIFDMAIDNIRLGHTSPWHIQINATLRVNLTTKDQSTMWSYTTLVQGEFPIDDLKDPLYTIGTFGRVPTVIRQVNVSRPFITASNVTTNLEVIYNHTLYIEDPTAPSLLMRFQGNISNSTYGITSLVDTKVLDSQDIIVLTDRSVVDYIYFGPSSSSTNNIVNMPSEFLLDDAHLALFDAVGKTT